MAASFTKTLLQSECIAPGVKRVLVKILWNNTVATTGQTITPLDYGISTVHSITTAQPVLAADTGYVAQVDDPTTGVYPINLYYAANTAADSVLIIVPDGTDIGDTITSCVEIEGV
jgi:hypothetical protein